jgi:hypothetical protein
MKLRKFESKMFVKRLYCECEAEMEHRILHGGFKDGNVIYKHVHICKSCGKECFLPKEERYPERSSEEVLVDESIR